MSIKFNKDGTIYNANGISSEVTVELLITIHNQLIIITDALGWEKNIKENKDNK